MNENITKTNDGFSVDGQGDDISLVNDKIKKLIELGEKATQNRWTCDTGMEVMTDNGCTVAYPHDEMFQDENFEDNMNFITAAANTRQEIKDMAAENVRMREALEYREYVKNKKDANDDEYSNVNLLCENALGEKS